jgi:hypothetical protein
MSRLAKNGLAFKPSTVAVHYIRQGSDCTVREIIKSNKEVTEWSPKPRMVKLVDLLVDYTDDRPIYKKCEEAGIAPSTFYRIWLKDENFARYYRERRERILRAHGALVDRSLVAKCRKGEVQAIKLFYERLREMGRMEEDVQTTAPLTVISSIPGPGDPVDHILAFVERMRKEDEKEPDE